MTVVPGPGPDKLVRNSSYLLLTTILTAGLGFLFWIVVARLFEPADVGVATSLISATSLIGYLSLLGLNSTLIRFPNSAARNVETTQAILLTAVAAGLIALAYVAAIPLLSPELAFVRSNLAFSAAFILFVVFGAVNMLTDAVFVARRVPHVNALVDGLLQGLTKLALPVVLAGLDTIGIVASVGWGYIVAAGASLVLLYRGYQVRFTIFPLRTPLLRRVGFSFASYVSSILNLAPIMLLPLLTLHLLGAEATAYYYLAFQIANLLNAASYAVGESLMAEASADFAKLRPLLRRSGTMLLALLVPGVIALAAASELLLRMFGTAYATQAQGLLILLSISAFAVGLNTWASFALKLIHRMGHLILSNVVFMLVTVGLAYAFAGHGVVGIGWAWLLGNAASGAYATVVLFDTGLHRPGLHRYPVRTPTPPADVDAGRREPLTPSRIVVINAYVRENAGDAALLAVCLQHVREAFPAARVAIAGMESRARHADFDGAPNLGSIRRYVADGTVLRRTRILRKALGFCSGLAYLALAPAARPQLNSLFPDEVRREVDALSHADLVVSMGGGYLNARPGLDGYQNLFFVLLPALIARVHQVPVVFAPQSYGPFPAQVQRRFVAAVLGRAALVLSREAVSVDILAECGLPEQEIVRAVDSGFAFDPPTTIDWRARLGVAADTPLVGMTARQWLPPEQQHAYERALAQTIDYLTAEGAQVVLIPQVTSDYLGDDDRIVSRRVRVHCATKPLRIDDTIDYRELKGLYRECDMLIGTRFHSVIFALTSLVPCIAIEYEHKTRGIMRELGLEDWVVPITDVTFERLRALVDRLRAERTAYLQQLDETLPAYVARAQALPELLRSLQASPQRALATTGADR